jgi:hypothetical protein
MVAGGNHHEKHAEKGKAECKRCDGNHEQVLI